MDGVSQHRMNSTITTTSPSGRTNALLSHVAKTSPIIFIVNTPIVRYLTFKEFKAMDETKGFSKEKLKSVWEKMASVAAKNGTIVAEADTWFHEEDENYVFGEVNELIDETISEAVEEVEEEEKEKPELNKDGIDLRDVPWLRFLDDLTPHLTPEEAEYFEGISTQCDYYLRLAMAGVKYGLPCPPNPPSPWTR